MYSLPNLEPVGCSMSGSNGCFLTCIQVSQEAGKVVCKKRKFQTEMTFNNIGINSLEYLKNSQSFAFPARVDAVTQACHKGVGCHSISRLRLAWYCLTLCLAPDPRSLLLSRLHFLPSNMEQKSWASLWVNQFGQILSKIHHCGQGEGACLERITYPKLHHCCHHVRTTSELSDAGLPWCFSA